MTDNTRIYLVMGAPCGPRLIRAANKAQARNHVSRETLTAKLASQDDLIVAVNAGVKVEEAGDEAEAA